MSSSLKVLPVLVRVKSNSQAQAQAQAQAWRRQDRRL